METIGRLPFSLQTYLKDEDPFDKGESKARESSASASHGVGEAERKAKADPVEKKSHCRKIYIQNSK